MNLDSVSCRLCQISTSRVFEIEKSEKLQVRHCKVCGLEFIAPQPSNQLLSQEYNNYYLRRKIDIDRPKQFHFSRLLAELQIDLNGKRVVDLGGAEGDFARAALEMFPSVELTVVEANTENQEFFADLKLRMENRWVEDFLSNTKEQFDFVFLFDVLEHVRDPQMVMSKIASVLSPAGEVIATFPNSQSITRKLMGKMWFQFKLEHLFYFSRASVDKIVQTAGLKIKILEPLRKNLPLGFLLKVGSEFGPAPLKKLIKFILKITPKAVQHQRFPFFLGEWLLRAQK